MSPVVIKRFGKVPKYYDYDDRNKIGTFKISQKVVHQTYLCKTCMQKRSLSREFRRNKSSLLKNVNRAFYFHVNMSFRGCLHESQDKIKIETGRFSSCLYM